MLQRHHLFKVNLTNLNVSDKVIQSKPFQHNSIIIDASYNFASSYASSATGYTECYDSTIIAASLDKLSLTITDTDLSPLLQETFDSQLQYDTPVQQGRNNPSSPQSAHMPIITKHVDNNND